MKEATVEEAAMSAEELARAARDASERMQEMQNDSPELAQIEAAKQDTEVVLAPLDEHSPLAAGANFPAIFAQIHKRSRTHTNYDQTAMFDCGQL